MIDKKNLNAEKPDSLEPRNRNKEEGSRIKNHSHGGGEETEKGEAKN